MLTDYDIQRISSAIVDNLVNNEGFMKRVSKMMAGKKKMVSSSAAAAILGVSRKTICEIAPYLGGIKGNGKSAHWLFPEDEIIDNYRRFKQI